MSEKCVHCNRCKNGCDYCVCCGKCQRCGMQLLSPAMNPPVFIPMPYPVPQPTPAPIRPIWPTWPNPGDITQPIWFERPYTITCTQLDAEVMKNWEPPHGQNIMGTQYFA